MTDPLEICIRISNSVCALLAKGSLNFRTWTEVEKNSGTEAMVKLMVAKTEESAFAEVSINCAISEENFSKRFIETQVISSEWQEKDVPRIQEAGIEEFLKSQAEKLAPATVSLLNNYRVQGKKGVVASKWLRVMFQSVTDEIDVSKDEMVDGEAFALSICADLAKLHALRQELGKK